MSSMVQPATATDWLHHPSLILPAYTYADAARYARIPAQTVRNWFRGAYSPGHTMHPVMANPGEHGLSYLQLAEVAFIAAMRGRNIKLAALRAAYDHVRTELGVEYPFVREQFLTNGADLFLAAIDDPTALVSASRPGQRAWRAAVETYIDQFDYDQHVALIWHPRGRFNSIVIDPRMSFGRPTIEGKGVPTEAIAARYAAGDDLEFLAYDFDLTQDQLKDALWFEDSIHPAA